MMSLGRILRRHNCFSISFEIRSKKDNNVALSRTNALISTKSSIKLNLKMAEDKSLCFEF